MIPLRDNIPPRTFPWVNYTLILVSTLAFLIQVGTEDGEQWIERLGMIPARVVDPDAVVEIVEPVVIQTPFGMGVSQKQREALPSAVTPWLTLLTCIFLHGGWMHVIGNLWFLHIFGDNVEDRFGHLGYLIFYLLCGVSASAAHLATDPGSTIPTIGASGAIAGVMGAYLILYPKAVVFSLVPIVFIVQMMVIPAPIFLGIWFLLQFLQGTAILGGAAQGGVAWWAHIGGFLVGVTIAWLLNKFHVARPPVQQRRTKEEYLSSYL